MRLEKDILIEGKIIKKGTNIKIKSLKEMMSSHNYVIESPDGEFYVSYDPIDTIIYGDVTTALVYGQMENFYILNGNHMDNYRKIIDKGFERCYQYFLDNIRDKNKKSEVQPPKKYLN